MCSFAFAAAFSRLIQKETQAKAAVLATLLEFDRLQAPMPDDHTDPSHPAELDPVTLLKTFKRIESFEPRRVGALQAPTLANRCLQPLGHLTVVAARWRRIREALELAVDVRALRLAARLDQRSLTMSEVGYSPANH